MGPLAAATDPVVHSAHVKPGDPVELGDLIDAVYVAGFDTQCWPDVCARIALRIGAQHVHLTLLPDESAFPLDEWAGIDASTSAQCAACAAAHRTRHGIAR